MLGFLLGLIIGACSVYLFKKEIDNFLNKFNKKA